jgi:hypothetical protein
MTADAWTFKSTIDDLVAALPSEACCSCECFLGYIAQRQIDGPRELKALLAEYRVERDATHSCLGCDPCPPADALVTYLQSRGDAACHCE